MKSISVILPSLCPQKLKKTFPPLLQAGRNLIEEILLITDRPDPQEIELLQDFQAGNLEFPIYILINPFIAGIGKALNQGFKLAKGKYIFILEENIFINKDTVLLLLKALKKFPEIGWISVRQRETFNINTFTPMCSLIERKLVLELEGWDENFKVAYDDTDFYFRIVKKGFTPKGIKEHAVSHPESQTWRYKDPLRIKYIQEDYKRFIEKHGEKAKHFQWLFVPLISEEEIL